MARVLGVGGLAGCISFGLGIGKSAFHVSSLGGGGAKADVPRSVLARFGWCPSQSLGWPGLRS